MNWLCERRGQKVLENPRLRLGDIHFAPQLDRAEMSAETWALLEADADKGRDYAIARSRAMRAKKSVNTTILMQPDADEAPSRDPLATLEGKVRELSLLLHTATEPGTGTAIELLDRRREVQQLLLNVQARTNHAANVLGIIDELLDQKVLI